MVAIRAAAFEECPMSRLISFLLLASAAAAPLAAQVADPQDQRPPRGERGDWRGDRAGRSNAQPRAQGQPQVQQAQPQAGPAGRPGAGQYGQAGGADPRRGDWRGGDREGYGNDGRGAPPPGSVPSGGLAQRPAGTPNDRFGRPGNGPNNAVDPRGRDDRNRAFAGWPGAGPDNGFDRRGGYDRNERLDPRDGGRNGYAGRPGVGRGEGYAGRPGEWRDDRHFEGGGGWSSQWRSDRRYDWQGYRAANRSLYRAPRYYGPRGYDYAPWRAGLRVQPFFYGQSYWINDPWRYRLPPAGGYYRWVRYYDDVALIDIRSGLIEDIIYSFFWR
jgi:Ni/Co efflux regulator RcnB